MQLSDIDIVHAIRRGDHKAFRELYRRYAELIYNSILVRVRSSFDADDIFQDFFVKLWERRESLNVETNAKSYLLVALRNHIFNTIKENQIRQMYHNSPEAATQQAEDYEWSRIESRDLVEQLRTVADRFPPGLKAVYLLRREENLSVREIARKLSVSEQTVKNQMADINKRLRAAVQNKNFSLFI